MDQPAQERARGEDHRAGPDAAAIAGDNAGRGATLHDQVLHRPLDHLEIRRGADGRLHREAIELAVGLGARPLHRGALGTIEQAELDAGGVGHPAHQAVQRIDLAHQMALAEPADGRVARHLADGGELVGDQRRARAHAGSGSGGLAAGMAAAHHDDVEEVLGHDRVLQARNSGRNLAEGPPARKGGGRNLFQAKQTWLPLPVLTGRGLG